MLTRRILRAMRNWLRNMTDQDFDILLAIVFCVVASAFFYGQMIGEDNARMDREREERISIRNAATEFPGEFALERYQATTAGGLSAGRSFPGRSPQFAHDYKGQIERQAEGQPEGQQGGQSAR